MGNPLANGSVDKRAAAPSGDDATLGVLLRRAREQRGLTLEGISNQTKIPRRHLAAMEQGNLTAIPGGFYRRAQIRTYADVVGVDRNLALARLERALTEPSATEAGPPRPRSPFPASFTRRTLIAVGLVMAATALIAVAQSVRGRAAEPLYTAPLAPGTPRILVAQPEPPPPVPAPVDQAASAPLILREESEAEGELIVTTQPAGSRVTVNGIGRGVTPVTIRHLPLEATRVRVTKDGYAAAELVVHLGAERPAATLDIALQTTTSPDEQ